MKKILLSLAAFVAGCNTDPGTPGNSGSFMPLKTGNRWDYVNRGMPYASMQVMGDTLIDNIAYFKVVTDDYAEAFRFDGDGNLERRGPGSRRNFYDFRKESGEEYSYPSCLGCDSVFVAVRKLPEFSVRGKTYYGCMSFAFDVRGIVDEETEQTLCRGVGIVKQTSQIGDILLDSYNLN